MANGNGTGGTGYNASGGGGGYNGGVGGNGVVFLYTWTLNY